MKLRLTKKGLSVPSFKLTPTDIQQQATADLLRYNKAYYKRFGGNPQAPLDIDNFVKELWDIEVVYGDLPQSEDKDVLGRFEPENQCIIVDAKACNNLKRISFTVAHEAGHMSLHAFLFIFQNGKMVGHKKELSHSNKNLERQADLYAASLLAPKQDVYNFLAEKGLSTGNILAVPIDLSVYATAFQERFGLSRQALEIRLCQLGLSIANKKYPD